MVVILGAGGHAREVYFYLDRLCVECFVDETLEEEGRLFACPVYPKVPEGTIWLFCGVASPSVKKSFDERFEDFETDWHRTTLMGPDCEIEEGVIVGANVVLTADIHIGRLTSINSNSLISHGCKIGKYCHISGGTTLAGDVTLEDEVYVGVGAKFLPKVKIGKGAVIGAGAVVTKDVPERAVIVGVPGKVQRVLQEGESFRL